MPNYSLTKRDRKGDLSKRWYVELVLDEPRRQLKLYGGINRQKNLKSRRKALNQLYKAYKELLKQGWRPDPVVKKVKSYEFLFQAIEDALIRESVTLSKSTITNYKSGRRLLWDYFEDTGSPPSSITKKSEGIQVVTYIKERYPNKNTQRAYQKWIGRCLTLSIGHNPLEGLTPRKQKTSKAPAFDEEDFRKFMDSCRKNDPTLALAVRMIYYSGFRTGDLVTTQIKDINFKRNYIFVPSDNSKGKRDSHLKGGDQLFTDIKNHAGDSPKHFYLFGQGSHEMAPATKYPVPTDLARRFRSILKKSGLEGTRYSFYSVRKLAVIHLYEGGVKLANIQRYLRHKAPTTTVIYLADLGLEIPEGLHDSLKEI